jgi:hypothetical protein
VQAFRHPMAPEYRGFMSQCQLMTYEDLCGKLEQGGQDVMARHGRWEITMLRKEMRRGASADTEHFWVIGKKA